MSQYWEDFTARMNRNGATTKAREEKGLNKNFLQFRNLSPNRVEILYEGAPYICVLQSGNSRIGSQTERKITQYLLTDITLLLPEGAMFSTVEENTENVHYWLVLHRDLYAYYGYYKYKCVELDYTLKYVDKYGNLKTLYAYVNGTGEFDIREYFRYQQKNIVEVPNRALNLIIKENEDIDKGIKLIIGKETWKVVDSDKISIPGVYFTTVYKTALDEENDNLELKIADYTKINSSQIHFNYNDLIVDRVGAQPKAYYEKDGRVVNISLTYSSSNEEVVRVEDNELIVINEGLTTIISSSLDGVEVANFDIEVRDRIDNYLFIVGSSKVICADEERLEIITNYSGLTVEVSNPLLGTATLADNIITFKAKNALGSVNLLIKKDGLLVGSKELEIVSLWVI